MRILNLGSLNIDKVYSMDHFVVGGETLSSTKMEIFNGGKGLNQSVALAKAGAQVYHAGAIGYDGEALRRTLEGAGVNTRYLQKLDTVTGHAIIQLTPEGKNCIIISAGANGAITEEYIDRVLDDFTAGDLLLLQNEINNVDYAMREANKRGLKIALNASPVDSKLTKYPLELVDYFLINEIEGAYLSGMVDAKDKFAILHKLSEKFPKATVVLTVGEDGVVYKSGETILEHGIYKVKAVDTTAAGDTFCGFFLAGISAEKKEETCLEQASMASAIAVSRKGAANSIPTQDEVNAFAKYMQPKCDECK